MGWSPYQEAIFDFVENKSGNAVIQAVAGSGKSTTIVECTKRLPKVKAGGNLGGLQTATCVLLAFNKSIAEELKARGVNARTFHSATYSAVTQSRMINNVEANKMYTVCKQTLSGDDSFIYANFIMKLCGLAKQSGFGCLYKDTVNDWYTLADHHALELENEAGDIARAIELAQEVFEASHTSTMLDFDDLLYYAVKDNLSLPKYDYVFVDEGQDTNAIQRAIIRKMLKPHSRVIIVGDSHQAIYGFRGADSESLNLLRDEFNAIELPLTVSYRCQKKIVKFAQQWVSHIEAAPGALDGQVVNMRNHKLGQLVKDTVAGKPWGFGPTDLMVCRTTKPLVEFAYRCLRVKMPVKILGREIGQGLKALIAKMNARTVDDLEEKILQWAMREIDKAIAKSLEAKAESVQDKADCILCLIQGLPEDDIAAEGDEPSAVRTINALLDVIEQLFNPNVSALTLATIHKSKGMEADRVWWLNSSRQPSPWAKRQWQKEQELNLCYVAATRAISTLILIEDGTYTGQKDKGDSELRAPDLLQQLERKLALSNVQVD
jgi:DNA helicase-2/ATP-dependent DNA helicase PcrA